MQWITGLVLQIIFFSFGRTISHLHRDIPLQQTAFYSSNHSNCLLIELLSNPALKNHAYKSLAKIGWLTKNGTCYFENEKILIYFNNKLDIRQYSAGSWIITGKKLQPIENPTASGFDFKKYNALRHIYAELFLREKEFELLQLDREGSVFSRLDSLRKKLLIIIKKQIPSKTENSLLEALMVGFTDDMDPAVLKSYADTGVIHIIAISGLHLALICHILQLALKKTGRKKAVKWIRFGIMIGCLWGYSLLSGASPSVIRAAMMFSLVLLASNITRETVLYNTLASSAFLLLCYDPDWILDIGFQLSYAAVLSLRLFSKPVRLLFTPHNKILAMVWDAASVNIAAQILTTPISIYYFHRFPSYFLIANLLAVPLSSVILLGGIGLCVFYWVPPLADVLGLLLGLAIQLLNGFIYHISSMPGAVIPDLTLSLPQLFLAYFIIYCLYRFMKWKDKPWLLTGLAAISIFQFLHLIS